MATRIPPSGGPSPVMPPTGGSWTRDADGGLTPGDAQTAAAAGLTWPGGAPVAGAVLDAPNTQDAPVYLVSGGWFWAETICRLRCVGTGSLVVDGRDRSGVVTANILKRSFTGSTGAKPELLFANTAVQIRATFPPTLTVEVF